MAPGNVVNFTKERLRRSPVEYKAVFRHEGEKPSFVVYGVENTEVGRRVLAEVFEACARTLREGA